MESDSRIQSLFVRWQELREQGLLLAVEELCGDCPELIDELRRRISALDNAALVPGSDVTESLRLPTASPPTLPRWSRFPRPSAAIV